MTSGRAATAGNASPWLESRLPGWETGMGYTTLLKNVTTFVWPYSCLNGHLHYMQLFGSDENPVRPFLLSE